MTKTTGCVVTAPPESQEAWVLCPALPLDLGQVSSLDLSRFLPAFLRQSPTLGYREHEDYARPEESDYPGRPTLLYACLPCEMMHVHNANTNCKDEPHTEGSENTRMGGWTSAGLEP